MTTRVPPPVPVTVVWGSDVEVRGHLAGSGLASDPGVAVVGQPNRSQRPGPRSTRPPVTGERSQGCRCCRSRLDLVATIRAVVERPAVPHHVVVTVNPDEDLLVVLRTLLAEPDLEELVDLDAVIAVLDGPMLASRRATRSPLANDTLVEVLAIADQIIVTNWDAVVGIAQIGIARSLRPLTLMGKLSLGHKPAVQAGLLHAWHGVPPVHHALHPTAPPDPHGGTTTQAIRCSINSPVDPESFDRWLDDTIRTYGSRLLRTQGSVRVVGRTTPVCLRGVLSFATTTVSPPPCDPHPGATLHQHGDHSTFILVGRDLDGDVVTHGFQATAAA